jgi:hypothetical protein
MDDEDFSNRQKLGEAIDWFAFLSGPERALFLNRLEAQPLDSGGRELLEILAKLDHELFRAQEE